MTGTMVGVEVEGTRKECEIVSVLEEFISRGILLF